MLPWSTVWLCIAFIGCGYAQEEEEDLKWQSLRVRWSLDFLSPRNFARLPMTAREARSQGFSKLDGPCEYGKFLGNRYMKGLDTAAVLLYDTNGYIAGIQYGIPQKEILKASPIYSFETTPAFQLDKISMGGSNSMGGEEVYFLTAYFVDPAIICTSGRTREQFLEDGTGTGLFLQNGTDPLIDSIAVPLDEKDLEGTDWVKGGCSRTMGVHYWYDLHENSSCINVFPFAPTYSSGKLTNFVVISPGRYEFSGRFEHPSPPYLLKLLPRQFPKCVDDEYKASGGYSSMHIYFTLRPWNLKC